MGREVGGLFFRNAAFGSAADRSQLGLLLSELSCCLVHAALGSRRSAFFVTVRPLKPCLDLRVNLPFPRGNVFFFLFFTQGWAVFLFLVAAGIEEFLY